jgi:hypothetical protein
MVRKHQIALGAIGLVVMFAGGWLFWYFAVRPHHPSPYSLFEIAIVPLGLLIIGMLCLLAAVGAFTDSGLKLRTGSAKPRVNIQVPGRFSSYSPGAVERDNWLAGAGYRGSGMGGIHGWPQSASRSAVRTLTRCLAAVEM